jgi:hypothetical protein
MDKELLRKLISTLSGYSNPCNWTIVELDGGNTNGGGQIEYVAWTGPDDPMKLAQNILDLVAKDSTLMSNKEPDNRQYNTHYDV